MDRFDAMELEAKRKYDDEVSAAKKRLDEVVSAIKVLRNAFPENVAEKVPTVIRRRTVPPGAYVPKDQDKAYGEAVKTVRGTLPHVPPVFDHGDVASVIEKNFPGAAMEARSIREALRRLASNEEIGIESVGEGRRATKYKRPINIEFSV